MLSEAATVAGMWWEAALEKSLQSLKSLLISLLISFSLMKCTGKQREVEAGVHSRTRRAFRPQSSGILSFGGSGVWHRSQEFLAYT